MIISMIVILFALVFIPAHPMTPLRAFLHFYMVGWWIPLFPIALVMFYAPHSRFGNWLRSNKIFYAHTWWGKKFKI
jgi:hypothetical protein